VILDASVSGAMGLLHRRTAMLLLARPHARSLRGLLGPIVLSLSVGPDPLRKMIPAVGVVLGRLRVASTLILFVPVRVISSSLKRVESV
jgi:hypothetical protein